MNITAVLQLLNLVIPDVTNLILLIKNDTGGTTAIISSTQIQNASDTAAIQAWLALHQAPAAPATAPAPATPAA